MPEIDQRISHYRILKKIGQGGMGEVYLADDTTLNRKVALKFLPEAFTSDPERMARFEREAKLLASLNHPNIAGIHGLEQSAGTRFLVMEYVDGETLQAKLGKGALPLEDALGLCRQIAEGLEAAHEKGVIHRDLKPANVMITPEEKVKILDFGLAKALSDETQSIDSSQSPTLTEAMTQPGVILGTAAYMSPEQAKGKSVDKRADIWAFGCILYECLAGKKAFEGETVTETLAAILRGNPDWAALPATTPQNIRFVLRRCLEKDTNRRFHHAADVRIEIEEARDTGKAATHGKQRRPRLAWGTAILAVLVLLAVVFIHYGKQESPDATYSQISVPPMQNENGIAVSPDGHWIAFVASGSGSEASLFRCRIGSVTPQEIAGTEGASRPFWSPDSRRIAFFAGNSLKKVDVLGGPPQPICEGTGFGGTWNRDGIILFSRYPVIYSVPASGGEPAVISTPDISQGEAARILPRFLPDGRHYLYTAWFDTVSKNGIYLASLDSRENTRLITANSWAVYAEPGILLFQRAGTLFAQPFNIKKLKIAGEAKSITRDLLIDEFRLAAFDASETGVLIYRSVEGPSESRFLWVDRNGAPIEPAGEPARYLTNFAISPDGKQIAAVLEDPTTSNRDVWLLEWARNVRVPLTFNPSIEDGIAWSPDGHQIGFSSMRNGNADIYLKPAGSGGKETELLANPEDEWITDWSQNGKYIAYTFGLVNSDIYILPLDGDKKPLPFIESPDSQGDARFSFDGKWLAYQTWESGRSEIRVISFPDKRQSKPISDNGGVHPEWRKDGKELYYLSLDGHIMAVDIRTDADGIEAGKPRALFETNLIVNENKKQFAVTADGQRFLLLKPLTETTHIPITVVHNWAKLLEQ